MSSEETVTVSFDAVTDSPNALGRAERRPPSISAKSSSCNPILRDPAGAPTSGRW